MTNLTEFNKPRCAAISAAIETALKDVAQRYGIEIHTGNGSYTDNNFTVKVECSTISEDGQVNSKEVKGFKRLCLMVPELEESHLGRVFMHRGTEYRITGGNPKARRYPLLVTRLCDDRHMKFGSAAAVNGLV